jgi:hypothetical protein
MEDKSKEELRKIFSLGFDIGYSAGFEYARQKNCMKSEDEIKKDIEFDKKLIAINSKINYKNINLFKKEEITQ